VAALELVGVDIIGVLAETDIITSYPKGISLMAPGSGSGWTPNGGFGLVVTYYDQNTRASQTFYGNTNDKEWRRYYYKDDLGSGPGWGPWRFQGHEESLTATSYTQSSAVNTYPEGSSQMWITAAQATSQGWDFSANAGTLHTTRPWGTTDAQQFWVKGGGTSVASTIWVRTGNAGGWAIWKKLALLDNIITPTRMKFISSSPTNPIPVGAKTARIRTWGGAAGGGGVAAAPTGQSSHAGGGQAGGYSESYVDVSAFGGNIAVVIGTGGAGGVAGANDGTAGGATTINGTLVTASGGNPGKGGSPSAGIFPNSGGGGGTPGTGDISSVGAPGIFGFGGPGLCTGGYGGSSLVGSGGLGPALASANQSLAGTAGSGRAAGGGGAASSGGAGTTNVAGGAGTPGLAIIDFFYGV
jgi:hypothetical protein